MYEYDNKAFRAATGAPRYRHPPPVRDYSTSELNGNAYLTANRDLSPPPPQSSSSAARQPQPGTGGPYSPHSYEVQGITAAATEQPSSAAQQSRLSYRDRWQQQRAAMVRRSSRDYHSPTQQQQQSPEEQQQQSPGQYHRPYQQQQSPRQTSQQQSHEQPHQQPREVAPSAAQKGDTITDHDQGGFSQRQEFRRGASHDQNTVFQRPRAETSPSLDRSIAGYRQADEPSHDHSTLAQRQVPEPAATTTTSHNRSILSQRQTAEPTDRHDRSVIAHRQIAEPATNLNRSALSQRQIAEPAATNLNLSRTSQRPVSKPATSLDHSTLSQRPEPTTNLNRSTISQKQIPEPATSPGHSIYTQRPTIENSSYDQGVWPRDQSVLSDQNRSTTSAVSRRARTDPTGLRILSGEYRVNAPVVAYRTRPITPPSIDTKTTSSPESLNGFHDDTAVSSLTRDGKKPSRRRRSVRVLRDGLLSLSRRSLLNLSRLSPRSGGGRATLTLYGNDWGVLNSLMSLCILATAAAFVAFMALQLLFRLDARPPATSTPGSTLSNVSYSNVIEVATALTTFVLMLDVSCLMVAVMQCFFAAKLLKCSQGDERLVLQTTLLVYT